MTDPYKIRQAPTDAPLIAGGDADKALYEVDLYDADGRDMPTHEEFIDAMRFWIGEAQDARERMAVARRALLKVWPKGKDCEHEAAREAFVALGEA